MPLTELELYKCGYFTVVLIVSLMKWDTKIVDFNKQPLVTFTLSFVHVCPLGPYI